MAICIVWNKFMLVLTNHKEINTTKPTKQFKTNVEITVELERVWHLHDVDIWNKILTIEHGFPTARGWPKIFIAPQLVVNQEV